MANFGFTPGDSDGSEEPVDFAAMMAQMQKQIQEQFSGLTGGILQWDDQDYGYYVVSANPSVSTNVLVKCSWVDTSYPILMALRPFYVNILVVPN